MSLAMVRLRMVSLQMVGLCVTLLPILMIITAFIIIVVRVMEIGVVVMFLTAPIIRALESSLSESSPPKGMPGIHTSGRPTGGGTAGTGTGAAGNGAAGIGAAGTGSIAGGVGAISGDARSSVGRAGVELPSSLKSGRNLSGSRPPLRRNCWPLALYFPYVAMPSLLARGSTVSMVSDSEASRGSPMPSRPGAPSYIRVKRSPTFFHSPSKDFRPSVMRQTRLITRPSSSS